MYKNETKVELKLQPTEIPEFGGDERNCLG